MAIERQIIITRNAAGGVTFDPNPLQAGALDQIFWTNNDTVAHWPARKDGDTIDRDFFMTNQIAPGGDVSAVFSTSLAVTLNYVCFLHQTETGSIVIS